MKYQLHIELSEKEHTKLLKLLHTTALPRSALIRSLIMGKDIKEHPPETWVELVRQLSAVGNNINQIARAANTTGVVSKDQVDQIIATQSDIWRKVKNL